MTPRTSVYDCLCARVRQDGFDNYEVFCSAGHSLHSSAWYGTVGYIRVARGDPLELKACQDCGDLDPFDDPAVLPREEKGWVDGRKVKRRKVRNDNRRGH